MVVMWSLAVARLGASWWRPVIGRTNSKTRPADILLPNWVLGRTAALDVSITSPLNPITMLEAGVSATAAAQAIEYRKHQANDLRARMGMCPRGC